jgi:ATP-dependent Clp endopeptidase proteolytic subunit ClpP
VSKKKSKAQRSHERLVQIELRQQELLLTQAQVEHDEFMAKRAGQFFLHGDITAESSEALIQEMEAYVIAAIGGETTSIALHINSEGGDLSAGLAIHDTLRGFSGAGVQVVTGIRGEACSMAAVVVQAGDYRIMGGASRMMLHQVSSGGAGTTSEIRRQVEHLEATDRALAELFANRSGKFTADWLELQIHDRDLWFTAQEALERGLVDAIA